MGISSAPNVSKRHVNPVSKTDDSEIKFRPEFSSPLEHYREKEEEEINDEEKDKENPSDSSFADDDNPDFRRAITTEFFKLLKKYHFKDFFQLILTDNDFELTAVIKENRKSRGVSLAMPLTDEYAHSTRFIDQAEDLYHHTNWLMKDAPGKSYADTV